VAWGWGACSQPAVSRHRFSPMPQRQHGFPESFLPHLLHGTKKRACAAPASTLVRVSSGGRSSGKTRAMWWRKWTRMTQDPNSSWKERARQRRDRDSHNVFCQELRFVRACVWLSCSITRRSARVMRWSAACSCARELMMVVRAQSVHTQPAVGKRERDKGETETATTCSVKSCGS
jgi:hypothetical protein